MSEEVDSFPPPPHAKYDWVKWTNGKIHKCKRGVDFQTTPHNFVHSAYNWAERHGLVLRASTKGDEAWLQFAAEVPRSRRSPGRPIGRLLHKQNEFPSTHPPRGPLRDPNDSCDELAS